MRTSQKIEMNALTIKINGQQHTMKVDSGAEANIISEKTYQELRFKQVLQPSEAKFKSHSSPLLPLVGQFTATISTNRNQIKTIKYVTKNCKTQSLGSRYIAFDLSILHINANNKQVPIILHNIDVFQEDDQDMHTLNIQDAQHMEYSQMAKHLTSPELSKAFLRKISDLPQEVQLWRIKASFQDVYRGMDRCKYC